jgi:hypothetical protein
MSRPETKGLEPIVQSGQTHARSIDQEIYGQQRYLVVDQQSHRGRLGTCNGALAVVTSEKSIGLRSNQRK